MPARNGRQYLDGLRAQERLIYMGGERVRDVTKHLGLASGARAVAALYDMQHDPALAAEMTYTSPSSEDPVGLSFIIPRSHDDLIRRRNMMLHWARSTCGMMG
ncbi:MAG: 4-hydroxyphenylacetate 3-hydroxylase, partial [Hyphomicrobiales bacterium]|nr:4-hydroxyphenylacetate 3-hydroxylase [Hyphomicrobiales bacterium]